MKRITVTPAQRAYQLLLWGAVTGMAAGFILSDILFNMSLGPGYWAATVLLVVLVWYWYLTVVTEIQLNDDGTITFRSLTRQITLQPNDIYLVGRQRASGIATVRHAEGSLNVIYDVPEFEAFTEALKAGNMTAMIIDI